MHIFTKEQRKDIVDYFLKQQTPFVIRKTKDGFIDPSGQEVTDLYVFVHISSDRKHAQALLPQCMLQSH